MANPFALFTTVFNRNMRRAQKAHRSKPRQLSLVHLEDRITPTGNVAPVYENAFFNVPENRPVGYVVGTAAATDADAGQTLSYSILGGNTGNAFAINNSGEITVNAAVLDFETTPSYTLTVQATDNGDPALSDTATITINVTDLQTNVSINDIQLAEGNSGTKTFNFTVTSSAAVGTSFNLLANTANGTANASFDYTAVSNRSVSFAGTSAGETQIVSVTVHGDVRVELNQTFFVDLSGGGNDVTITDARGVGTITNDDTATFSIDDVTVNESAGTMTFLVSLSNPVDREVKVNVSFTDVETDLGDVKYANQQVTFPAFDNTQRSVTVTVIDDLFAENPETIRAAMALDGTTPLTGYSVSLPAAPAAGTITDNDPVVPVLTIAEDVFNSSGVTVASILGPGATGLGIAVVGVDNTNGKWQYSINNGVRWVNFSNGTGDVNLSSAARLLAETHKIRFVPARNYHGTVSLTSRIWSRAAGVAGSTVNLSQPSSVGGSTPFSAHTGLARITVTPVNDAPELIAGLPVLTPVAVGDSNPAGDTVANISGYMTTDIDVGVGDIKGIAVTALSGTAQGVWEYSLNSGTSWTAFGVVSVRSAVLLSANAKVRFVPNPGFIGTAQVYFRAWDGSDLATEGSRANVSVGGGIKAYSWITKTATVTVTDNTAPVLTPASPALDPIAEDVLAANNGGADIASIIGASVADADLEALSGIAVVSVDNTNGRWQYTTSNGRSWFDFTPARGRVVDLSDVAVPLADVETLTLTNKIRFVPNANYAGTSNFTYRAWDRTTGRPGWRVDLRQPLAVGGDTAFSQVTDTATIEVEGRNDAPVLAAGGPLLTQVDGSDPNPAGDVVSSFAGALISDVDAGALKGIAIIGMAGNGANGVWEFKAGTGEWTAIPAVSAGSALLLKETDAVRFRPLVPVFSGTATITYLAWDQTTGTAGQQVSIAASGGTTAFSLATRPQTAYMYSRNDAPVLAPGTPTLTSVTTNDPDLVGASVASLVGTTITDADNPLMVKEGIAVFATTGANGVWEFSTDGGASYDAFGRVTYTSALLLRDSDLVRFRPTVAEYVGSATMAYRAWDQTGATEGMHGKRYSTARTGGTTPFSAGTQTAVVRSNNAPVLATGGPALAQVNGNSPAPVGNLVGAFANSFISDLDAGALKGIAVTSVTGSNGVWQYKVAGGEWTAMGPVSFTSALLLKDTAEVRFLPNTALYNGTATITYRAWDQTGATAGQEGEKVSTATNGDFSPFSMATQTATSRSNLAPTLAFGAPTLTSVTTDSPAPVGEVVGDFANAAISDLDPGAVKGIAIFGMTGTNGVWEYKVGEGAWTAIGSVSAASSLLLKDTDMVRFRPTVAVFSGTATISYRAWDQTAGSAGQFVSTATTGNPTPFSTNTQTATVRSNNAPVLSGAAPTLTKVTSMDPPGDLVGAFTGGTISDLDAGDQQGIAVTGLVGFNGVWEYKVAGGEWTAVGAVSGNASLLLRDTDMIRFRPTLAGYTGTATITYRAWDRTSGTAGQKVSTATSGGITAFSSSLHIASVEVDLSA